MISRSQLSAVGLCFLSIFALLLMGNTSNIPMEQSNAEQTATALKATYEAEIQATVNALISGSATLTIEEAVAATIAALTPMPTHLPTLSATNQTATAVVPIVNKYLVEEWGPGFGNVLENPGFRNIGIRNIELRLSRIGNGVVSGQMSWVAEFPEPGLSGRGEAGAAVSIRGSYYSSLSQLRDIEFWDRIDGFDDENVVLWLRWSRTGSVIGEQNLTNVTLAIITNEGQMRGIVYDPARGNASIFDFTLWPSE